MKLATIFNNHTVLQANKPIRIYGTGNGTADIVFDGERHQTVSKNNFWCLTFLPRPYGGPYQLTVTLNGDTTQYTDIYIGDVLLLAGQSNIARKLRETSFPADQYESNSMLRYFASTRFDNEDDFAPEDGWIPCTEENAACFSALGYHIGMFMSKEKNIAVGLIACYLGSSKIESWIPKEIAEREEFYLPPEEKYDSPYVHGKHNENGKLYGIRQQSVVPYSLGRVVWYQGESNTGRSEWKNYTQLLRELIDCWRRDFMDASLPFTVVQIADWNKREDDAWRNIQKAQSRITEFTKNVTVIRSADVCENNDIHPATKINLAKRIFESIK